jgi:hypothetical protein
MSCSKLCVGKIKLLLCLIKLHTMKASGRVEVWLHAILISALGGGEQSV